MAVTFFTCADRAYEPFVLPYAASALIANPDDTVVEFCLERPRQFELANADAIGLLSDKFGPHRVRFKRGNFEGWPANSVRFLETPTTLTEFTYIGDIDILLLEPTARPHLAQMAKTGLPYSNVVRPTPPARLSGLHFTRSDVHYPLPVITDSTALRIDEHLLYLQVEAKGLPLPDPAERFRPAHGIHFSLNRPVKRQGRTDWGVSLPLAQGYLKLRKNPTWRSLLPLFDRRYLTLLTLLETAMEAHFPDLDVETDRPKEYSLRRLLD
ncbi:hypothetical protein [Devosia sp. CN2-171]|uniref:hypothetical protein n=1 Tax=Devosia sp. CN2-171 TaxID=3400909 RepID=UPI003BF8E50E